MKTICEYCIINKDGLKNYSQQPFSWKDRYNSDEFLKITNFREIATNIPDLIDRNHIINSIKDKKYYQAYAEILLWGLIGERPGSNRSKKTEIAIEALSHSKSGIENIFKEFDKGNDRNIENLYLSLEKDGKNKIKEVGVSYFTKILSFGSEASPNINKLLIYDKWTKLIHIHLLFDMKRNDLAKTYFSKNSLLKLYSSQKINGKPSTSLIYPKENQSWNAYSNYCQVMNDLSKEVSQKIETPISAFHLESFLFGKDLKTKTNKNDSNPRFWIQQNFSKYYLDKIRDL